METLVGGAKVLLTKHFLAVGSPAQLARLEPNLDEAIYRRGGHEVLLEFAPAERVVPFLEREYPNVQFTLHPTMNGFYVRGARKDILQIKSEIPNLDRKPL